MKENTVNIKEELQKIKDKRKDPTFKGGYSYLEMNDFEVRHGLIRDYNFTKDDKFEIRIRNSDPDQTEALLEKIKEWLQ